MKQQQFLDMASASMFSYIHFLRDMPRIRHPYAYENANVQKFIHSTGLHFDLVINEEYIADSFLMFAHKYKAPIVTICEFSIRFQLNHALVKSAIIVVYEYKIFSSICCDHEAKQLRSFLLY